MQTQTSLPPIALTDRVTSDFDVDEFIHVEVLVHPKQQNYFSVCITDARISQVLQGFYTWSEYETLIAFIKKDPHRYKLPEAIEKFPPLSDRTVRFMKYASPRF